ncbi:MAG TPA: 3D domain-containing protein [Thermoanaerobaculia bacterium]|nr:3D domain-containing protein [Thermoanaerobaculia bacterium]
MIVPLRAAVVLVLAVGALTVAAEPQKIGRAKVTFYYTLDESALRFAGKPSVDLRGPSGKVIARTTRRFRHALVVQGTGILRDGRTVFYYGKVGGEHRFRLTSKSKYGIGSTGCELVPFRTIAADPKFIPPRSRVYIPEMKGARLPDGTIHDGMFVATDRGHFRGAHVDLFVGVGYSGSKVFSRHGYGSRSRVTIYVDGKTRKCRP